MRRFRSAILAGIAAAGLLGLGPGPLPEPMPVSFRLADGARVTGKMTAWDPDGFDGTFGRRPWVELNTDDAWRLYRRVMDRDDASAWVDLGGLLLRMPAGAKLADRAFQRARRLDESVEEAIDAARAAAAEARRLRDAAEKAIESERLSTAHPESEPWRADAWPPLTPDEQVAATNTMRAEAEQILDAAGLALRPVETDFFLFYSDMPRRQTARWAAELDNMYKRLARIFYLPEQENIFWGKAVIFAFNEQDRFRLVEAQAFRHLAPPGIAGLCHCVGPKVFINFYRQPDDLRFAALLVHETVHGFLHRYRTPRRLPTWANEGFAEYLAAVTFANSPVDNGRRRQGLDFIRDGGDVNQVLAMAYADGTWPGRDGVGYSVGYLLVELMIRDRPRRFGDWVNAIKAGKDWRQALAEDFGATRDVLVGRFVQWYTVND
ncbi:MAG: hypothetical protein ACYTGG_05085 [Planctomycetota bacterium]|jgi:hypothetical protein